MIDDLDILLAEDVRNVIIHALLGKFFHHEARENETKATKQKQRIENDKTKVGQAASSRPQGRRMTHRLVPAEKREKRAPLARFVGLRDAQRTSGAGWETP